MRLLSKIFATSASVVPNASAKPEMSANEGWLIASGLFGCDLMLKSCASGRLSRRLRYRSMTARCRGVGVASAASAEPCAVAAPLNESKTRLGSRDVVLAGAHGVALAGDRHHHGGEYRQSRHPAWLDWRATPSLTMAIKFPIMEGLGIDLQRISLGALIIALGLLGARKTRTPCPIRSPRQARQGS